jgi:parallel beta-helix repeat protein
MTVYGLDMSGVAYEGDWGWPLDPSDLGAVAAAGIAGDPTPRFDMANGCWNQFNSSPGPSATSWDGHPADHDKGYMKWFRQVWSSDMDGNKVQPDGPSHMYNVESRVVPNANHPSGGTGSESDYCTFDLRVEVTPLNLTSVPKEYKMETWSRMYRAASNDEGCGWKWNTANAPVPPQDANSENAWVGGYPAGTWRHLTANEFAAVYAFVSIGNWGTVQTQSHSITWDSVVVEASCVAPAEVWVDDDWAGNTCGTPVDGHIFGYDAFAVIQDGVDAVETGGKVNVAAGTYGGFIVTTAGITIFGAQAHVDASGSTDRGTAGDGDESVVTGQITIKADDITLNGFKMTTSCVAVGYDHAHNVDIGYNIFENVTATWGAIHLHGGTHEADGGYIGYNTIVGPVGHGIWTVANDNVTIEHNHVLNCTGDRAIEALNHVGTGITIRSNVITNSAGKGINYWADEGGVIANNVISNSAYEAIFTDALATISGNQISGGAGYGILLCSGADGTTVSGNTISNPSFECIQSDVPAIIAGNDVSGGYNGIQLSNSASGSVVDGNDIHDNDYWGLSILDAVTEVAVTNNQISSNPYCGVTVWGDGQGSGIYINCNNITGNGIFGVESKRTLSPVDATYNWWGHASGPDHSTWWDYMGSQYGPNNGLGDGVSDYVLYDPWLKNPWPSGKVTGGGWMTASEEKATFGFNVELQGGAVTGGHLQFIHHGTKKKVRSESIDALFIHSATKIEFSGTCTVDGEGGHSFTCTAEDLGDPGKDADAFRITIDGTETFENTLGGGNIQIEIPGAGSQSVGSLRAAGASIRLQNSPNPFNERTAISFMLPASAHTTVRVYDSSGRVVATLIDGDLSPGLHSATWDAHRIPSGMYFCRVTSGSLSATNKMVVVK